MSITKCISVITALVLATLLIVGVTQISSESTKDSTQYSDENVNLIKRIISSESK